MLSHLALSNSHLWLYTKTTKKISKTIYNLNEDAYIYKYTNMFSYTCTHTHTQTWLALSLRMAYYVRKLKFIETFSTLCCFWSITKCICVCSPLFYWNQVVELQRRLNLCNNKYINHKQGADTKEFNTKQKSAAYYWVISINMFIYIYKLY